MASCLLASQNFKIGTNQLFNILMFVDAVHNMAYNITMLRD